MRPVAFHPLRGDRPQFRLEIDLLPGHESDVSGACPGEDEKFKRPRRHSPPFTEPDHEGADLLPGDRRVVDDLGDFRGLRQDLVEVMFPARRILAVARFIDLGPGEHGFDPLPL